MLSKPLSLVFTSIPRACPTNPYLGGSKRNDEGSVFMLESLVHESQARYVVVAGLTREIVLAECSGQV